MKTRLAIFLLFALAGIAAAQEFNKVPKAWKWISDNEAVFTYDGTYTDSTAFSVNARTGRSRSTVSTNMGL